MKMVKVSQNKMDGLPGCWTCGQYPAVPLEAREWSSARKLLETAGWKVRLRADFFDQQQEIVELYQLWCPRCEEDSGPPFKTEPTGLFGCLYRMFILVGAVLWTAWWLKA